MSSYDLVIVESSNLTVALLHIFLPSLVCTASARLVIMSVRSSSVSVHMDVAYMRIREGDKANCSIKQVRNKTQFQKSKKTHRVKFVPMLNTFISQFESTN